VTSRRLGRPSKTLGLTCLSPMRATSSGLRTERPRWFCGNNMDGGLSAPQFPSLAWNTADYWRKHPGIVHQRARGSGRPRAMDETTEFKLVHAICCARRRGESISEAKAIEMIKELAPNVKGTRPHLMRIMADYGLAGPFVGHLREPGWFPDEDHLASDSSEDLAKDVLFASDDILEYLADSRAKRILLELRGLGQEKLLLTDIPQAIRLASDSASERGLNAADNVVLNDESRWESGTRSQHTLDVEKTRRAQYQFPRRDGDVVFVRFGEKMSSSVCHRLRKAGGLFHPHASRAWAFRHRSIA